MLIYFLNFFLYLFASPGFSLSNPSIDPANPNFQTGLTTLVNAGILDTNVQAFNFLYQNVMSNNSLRAAVGILGNNMILDGKVFGFTLNVMSFDNTRMIIQAFAHSNNNKITVLKICYMVSGYAELHVNRVNYPFGIFSFMIVFASDSVLNPLISDFTTCPDAMQCRSTSISLPYAGIANTRKAIALIAGYIVNDFKNGMGVNPVFGLGLINLNPGTNSLGLTVIVYGRALLTSISIHYISFELQSLNVLGDKTIITDSSNIGCSYTSTGCQNWHPANINTSLSTTGTGISTFYATNYLFGLSQLIVGYDGTDNYAVNFTISTTALSGTSYASSFAYTGSADLKFYSTFSYLIILQFYCPSTGSDIYYVYGANTCNNTCNNTIGQYWDGSLRCQLCGPKCYMCSGSATLCTQCYASQNRIISGNTCICHPLGYYDDGSSLTCPACHYSCRSCTGPSASQCIDCLASSFRTAFINSCFCNPGYYDVGVSLCSSCHYTCQTCSSWNSNNCVTCSAANFREINSVAGTCGCMVGYYNSGTNPQCALCHYSCWTCSNTGISACSTCNNTMEFRVATPVAGQCQCITGYYDSNTEICQPCHVTCFTCDGPGRIDCKGCDNTKFRALQSGQCKCKAKYYEVDVTCYPCHITCFNCTGGTTTECINCNSGVTFRLWNGTSGQCYCQNGYVEVFAVNCQKCDKTCLTCEVSSTSCKTCDPAKNRFLTGSSCPCISGFIETGLLTGFCPKCHYSCLTCSGTASTQCVQCDTALRSFSGGKCLCPTHMYDNNITMLCYNCNNECLECSDQYQTTCLTCDFLYLREIVGTAPKPCTCIQRYFENNNALMCNPCHFSCLICSVVSTNCTACDSTTDHRYLASGSICICEAHYYEVSAQSCSSCIVTCGNCSIQPDNCTSCPSDRYLSGTNCLCNLGTYQDPFLMCLACHYYCKTCQNSTTLCLTCPAFTFRTLNSANCPCDFGYYDNNVPICVKCSYRCLGCTGPAPPQCIDCPASSQRTLQPDKTCPCNVGYYDDGTNTICQICRNTCASCTTFSVCTTCFPLATQFRTLLNNQCKCTTGYYDNFVNPICQPCHYSCLSCNGGLLTNCMTCQTNRVFKPASFSCPCQNGFYESAQVCYACSNTCSTCSGISTNCTSCDVAIRYLLSNQCFCRQGYFQNGGSCTACNIACRTCITSATNCLSCNVSHSTVFSAGSCTCLPGQYQNPVTLVCIACNLKCETCSGMGQTACVTCRSTSFRTHNSVNFTCDCNPGCFDDGNATCAACHSTCMTCYGPTQMNCTSCYPGANKLGSTCRIPVTCSSGLKYQGFCLTVCPNTTFPATNVCQTCVNNCKTCTSATVCTSCIENYFFNVTSSICTINCPQGAFMNRLTHNCQLCPIGCDICAQRDGTVVCPKCLPGFYLFNHTRCVDLVFCAVPHYVIVGIRCSPCEFPCQTCNNLSFDGCITCRDGFSFYGGQCLSICPVGYYSFQKVCLQCQARCSKCSSTACELCNQGYYLTPQEQNPKCITSQFFFNPSRNQEEKCHPNCFSCTNSSFSSCITCVKFRGDDSEMAISGYCQCWSDSIDLGEGICSFDKFQEIQTYNKGLKATTDSAMYIAGVSSVFSANFMSAAVFMIYQQSYSIFYFVNSSAVLQTDNYLKQSLNKNINFYLNNRKAENITNPSYSSRLLVDLQKDESLFSRGHKYEMYLFDWALYTVIITLSLWLCVIVSNCALKSKAVLQSEMWKSVFINVKSIIQQSVIIIVHLLTVSQISLYATVTFKFLLEQQGGFEKNIFKFLLSVALVVYYIGYIFRLLFGCCTIGQSDDLEKRNAYNPLKCLIFYFDETKLEEKKSKNKNNKKVPAMKKSKFAETPIMRKLYVPFLMIRLVLGSVLIILLSAEPRLQVGSVLGVMVIWTIYSLLCCPYPKFCKIFIHLNEFVYIGQIGIMLYSVTSPQGSRIMPAYIQLSLNGLQIALIIIFSILFTVKLIYGICQQKKASKNKVENIYFNENQSQSENNHSQLYLNQNKRDDQIGQFAIDGNVFQKEFQKAGILDERQGQNKNGSKSIILQDFVSSSKKLTSKGLKLAGQQNTGSKLNISNAIQNQNNETQIIPQEEVASQQKVIIRKKYRAVRKNHK